MEKIESYKDVNSTRAFVQTYDDDEVKIEFEGQLVSVRIRIGTNKGNQIIMLENGNFYLTTGFATTIKPSEEIVPYKAIQLLIEQIEQVNNNIGALSKLKTRNTNSLIDAINELSRELSTPRRIKGYIKYLSDNGIETFSKDCKDLEIRYNDITKSFEYYSEVGEWIKLPRCWQKLKNIIRKSEELPENPEIGDTYAILEDEKIVAYYDEQWLEVNVIEDCPGDEYLVQHIYNNQFEGNATGSVIYTPNGWVYLINYNN